MRLLEVELQILFQIRERFLFGLALTGDVDLEAPRHIPVAFAPHGCGNGRFIDYTFSHSSARTVSGEPDGG